jgi:hypothetical protein
MQEPILFFLLGTIQTNRTQENRPQTVLIRDTVQSAFTRQQCYTYGISLRSNLTDMTWNRVIGENEHGSSSQIFPIQSAAHTSVRNKNSVGIHP